jgi:hypothetical protein
VCHAIDYPINKVIRSEHLLERDMDQWVGLKRDDAWTPDVMDTFHKDPWHFRPGVAGK